MYFEMNTADVVKAGSDLSTLGSGLKSDVTLPTVGGIADYPEVTGALSSLVADWQAPLTRLATSIEALGETTGNIGHAVAADDDHRAGIFRTDKGEHAPVGAK